MKDPDKLLAEARAHAENAVAANTMIRWESAAPDPDATSCAACNGESIGSVVAGATSLSLCVTHIRWLASFLQTIESIESPGIWAHVIFSSEKHVLGIQISKTLKPPRTSEGRTVSVMIIKSIASTLADVLQTTSEDLLSEAISAKTIGGAIRVRGKAQ